MAATIPDRAHGALLRGCRRDFQTRRYRFTPSVRLAAQECRDVQVAAVVAAEVRRGRRRRGRGFAAAVGLAAAQARRDALANPECRRGLVLDQHARGAIATALRTNQLHLRLAHDVVAEARSEEQTSEIQALMSLSYD